jgi:hypothetical protein
VLGWLIYRGSGSLLALIALGNLANLTLFSSAIPGPEQYLAGRPLMVVTLVFVPIVATLALVGLLAEHGSLVREPARPTGREAAQPHERA